MTVESDVAELSSLRAQTDELAERVVRIADGYRETDESAATNELDQAERALVAARRALERAAAVLGEFA